MSRLSSSEILLKRVMFDPLSYISPQRLHLSSRLTENHHSKAIVNDIILKSFGLELGFVGTHSLDYTWVRHWYLWPKVVFLIGCYTMRAELAWQGAMLKIPEWSRNFLTTSLSIDTVFYQQDGRQCRQHPTHDELIMAGYSSLKPWTSRLSTALEQRFQLFFPCCVDDSNATILRPEVEPLILLLALQYAQKHPCN